MKTVLGGLFFSGLITLGLSACGGKSENMSYEYTVNGCETGKHEFDSKEAYCAALKDDALNHGCASSLRQETFTNNCK